MKKVNETRKVVEENAANLANLKNFLDGKPANDANSNFEKEQNYLKTIDVQKPRNINSLVNRKVISSDNSKKVNLQFNLLFIYLLTTSGCPFCSKMRFNSSRFRI